MSAVPPVKPCLQWPGSKVRLAPTIIGLLGPHRTYVEPYFGSGAVLMAKPRSNAEIVNDADNEVVNFYLVLREQPDDLIEALRLTPCAEAEFKASRFPDPGASPVERARRFFVRTCQGHGGPNGRWVPSGAPDNLGAKWLRRLERLGPVAQRLQGVQVYSRDALDVIAKTAGDAGAAIYLDPPYLSDVLAWDRHYTDTSGMQVQHHKDMLELARDARATVAISGYPHQFYEEFLQGWSRYEFRSDHLGDPLKRSVRGSRTEVVWVNRRGPLTLFD